MQACRSHGLTPCSNCYCSWALSPLLSSACVYLFGEYITHQPCVKLHLSSLYFGETIPSSILVEFKRTNLTEIVSLGSHYIDPLFTCAQRSIVTLVTINHCNCPCAPDVEVGDFGLIMERCHLTSITYSPDCVSEEGKV